MWDKFDKWMRRNRLIILIYSVTAAVIYVNALVFALFIRDSGRTFLILMLFFWITCIPWQLTRDLFGDEEDQ